MWCKAVFQAECQAPCLQKKDVSFVIYDFLLFSQSVLAFHFTTSIKISTHQEEKNST